jgi:demethylmenaquinone methyltransferase/2-methoxy-6-polyprenyl-1,4-benzoquinol methylase
MCRQASNAQNNYPHLTIKIFERNALDSQITDSSIDCVISSFGLKTLSDDQKNIFAQEISCILKPNGLFSLIEISVPRHRFLKFLYMFYLKSLLS